MRRLFIHLVAAAGTATLFSLGSCPAAAQQATGVVPATTKYSHAEAPTARAARRSGVIRVDGHLDEQAWAAATPVTDFRQIDPHEGEPVAA